MSTQPNVQAIPFTISSEQHNFRLLELPQGLLDLIDEPSPPILTIKSADPSAVQNATSPLKHAHIVLCTSDKTFQIRQVQTSNSVLIVQSVTAAADPAGSSLAPGQCLSAIAQCMATLELHPETSSPLQPLNNALLEYNHADDLEDRQSLPADSSGKTKADLIANLPFSDGECEIAWRELCAFEASDRCWRPSAKAQEEAWRAILAAATAEGIDIGSPFSSRNIYRALEDEENPLQFYQAIFALLSSDIPRAREEELQINRTICVPWVGRVVLSSATMNAGSINPVPLTSFLSNWRDALPEAWRDSAQLDLIKDHYNLVTPTTVALKEVVSPAGGGNTVQATDKKRKWHDMFKAGRK